MELVLEQLVRLPNKIHWNSYYTEIEITRWFQRDFKKEPQINGTQFELM
jgi:hypothetical protein